MPHARYDYEICVPLGIGKWKEFHVPKWEELLNGLGLVGKVMCLVPTQLLVLGLSYLWTIMALFRLLKPVLWNSFFDKGLVTFFVQICISLYLLFDPRPYLNHPLFLFQAQW